jgi:segregation and condensation protein A
MAYRVKLEVFEGPFDLLLHLISRQKVDIRDIPLASIADDYLAYIDRMENLDLDVASDFLLVAATLMELKASSLLPAGPLDTDDLEELTAAETREVLIARLIEYRTCKNAAAELEARAEALSKLHPREAGLEETFVGLLPDFLAEVTLEELAMRCALLLGRREVPVIEASHIGGIPLSVERRIETVMERVRRAGRVTFVELVGDIRERAEFVVALLAVLELYKRGDVELAQTERFGSIDIRYVGQAA